MRRRMGLLANRERTKMCFLRFGKAALVCVKNGEVIQDRSNIRMIRAKLLFINLQSVKIIRLRGFLPPGPSIDQGDVVQHRPEIGIREILQFGASLKGNLVVPDGGIGFAKIVAEKSKPAGRTKKCAAVDRLGFFQKAVYFDKIRLGGGPIARLVMELTELFQTERVVAVAGLKSALG